MTTDKNDLSATSDDALFAALLIAIRAGLATPPSKVTTQAERDILEGLARAAERDPDELHELAKRCTFDKATGKVELPADCSDEVRAAEHDPLGTANKAKLLALLAP